MLADVDLVFSVLRGDCQDILDEFDDFLTSWSLRGPRRNRFPQAAAAQRGVTVTNRSDTEDLVMLKHFGPGNPDAKGLTK